MTFRKPLYGSTPAATLWHFNTPSGFLASYSGWKLSRRDGATLYFAHYSSNHLTLFTFFVQGGSFFLCTVDFLFNEDELGKAHKLDFSQWQRSKGPNSPHGSPCGIQTAAGRKGPVDFVLQCLQGVFFNFESFALCLNAPPFKLTKCQLVECRKSKQTKVCDFHLVWWFHIRKRGKSPRRHLWRSGNKICTINLDASGKLLLLLSFGFGSRLCRVTTICAKKSKMFKWLALQVQLCYWEQKLALTDSWPLLSLHSQGGR